MIISWIEFSFMEIHDWDSISHTMSFILSGLSTEFNLKEATYCAIVAGIIGHLSFFLHQESPKPKNSLERAAKIYQRSTCDTSVKQAVERIFQPPSPSPSPNPSPVKCGFFKTLFKRSHVNVIDNVNLVVPPMTVPINHTLLAEEAINIALNNLLSRK